MKTPSPLRLGFLALLATAATAAAQTTWTGASGGSWEAPENWSSGVPAFNIAVSLPALSNPYTISLNSSPAFEYINVLTIGNGAALDVNALLQARGASGAVALTVASGGKLNVNSGGDFRARRSATGAIIASITGTVTVNGGTLVSSTDSGAGKRFEVNSGGKVVLNNATASFLDGGFRLYAGSATEVSGGTVTSTVFDWYGGASFTLSLNGGFANPLWSITGAFNRQSGIGGGYTLSLLDAGVTPGTTYTLANFGSTTFSLSDITLSTSIPGTLGLTPTSLTYTVAAVPEPSTVALGVGLLGLSAGRLWKRRRLQNF